jgi:hypothetical protein
VESLNDPTGKEEIYTAGHYRLIKREIVGALSRIERERKRKKKNDRDYRKEKKNNHLKASHAEEETAVQSVHPIRRKFEQQHQQQQNISPLGCWYTVGGEEKKIRKEEDEKNEKMLF